MKHLLIGLAALAIGIPAFAVGLLTLFQRRLLYVPDTTRPDLAAAGIPGAVVTSVRTSDGLDLLAWFVPPADQTQPVVLYLHGNGGNIGYRTSRMRTFQNLGWGVMMLEYRGYGGNPGRPTEAGLIRDARAAYATLRGMDISAHRILLWGESLGTGVAIQLAAEVPTGPVLLESPYTSIAAIAKLQYPLVPVDWLLLDRFDSLARIGAVHAPVLVMTGGRDTIVPPSMGRAIFAAANEPKQFWFAADADHNDLGGAGALAVARAFAARFETP
jgi:fermentation-respiration switch protein FrsA (DUF1100 family)